MPEDSETSARAHHCGLPKMTRARRSVQPLDKRIGVRTTPPIMHRAKLRQKVARKQTQTQPQHRHDDNVGAAGRLVEDTRHAHLCRTPSQEPVRNGGASLQRRAAEQLVMFHGLPAGGCYCISAALVTAEVVQSAWAFPTPSAAMACRRRKGMYARR